jgi:hypothetical protein
MCAERLHRIVIAIILGFVMGMAGVGMLKIAFLAQLFVMIMLIIWAFTDFCPSLYLLKKIIPPCYETKNQ